MRIKTYILAIGILINIIPAIAQELDEIQLRLDSIENTFHYEHGKIPLSNGLGMITVPEGFKYLNAEQSDYVLTTLWGNPKSNNSTLGLIFPESSGIFTTDGYVFNIQYDEIGYVKDTDADDIDYDDLLKDMQKEMTEENKSRIANGYDRIEIIGWAAKPFYDRERKILHWAKEVKFGEDQVNTLNYNVRLLGRKGVLVLNAISSMEQLPMVQNNIEKVLNIVQFSDGNQYKDFNPDIDNVAAWTIGGLVAGKILAKVGFFALILKFWKVIILAIGGAIAVLRKKFKTKKNEQVPVETKQIENT